MQIAGVRADVCCVHRSFGIRDEKIGVVGREVRLLARERALLISVAMAVVLIPTLCQIALGDPMVTGAVGLIVAFVAAALLMIGAGASVSREVPHARLLGPARPAL